MLPLFFFDIFVWQFFFLFLFQLNFIFFINIIRVLFLKMFAQTAANYAPKYKYRTWFRSTLVLVPLFGVHYMIFLAFTTITFNSYDIFEIIWLYADLTFTTFQVSLNESRDMSWNESFILEEKKIKSNQILVEIPGK